MLRYLTAGESHGKCLQAVIEGLPYGSPIDLDLINAELVRRQGGYGRGARMKIEEDKAEIIAGVRQGHTLGSPVVLQIANKVSNGEQLAPLTRPRPGHADLAGAIKFGTTDARDVSERASARETAARVAAGTLARGFLKTFGIGIAGRVVEIGGVSGGEDKIKARIDAAREAGDTVGGIFEVTATGLPPGLGSHAGWEDKLDGALARALMSVQTVKAVEVGLGLEAARKSGSELHDPIVMKGGKLGRTSNNAGGIEGGMTNGQPLVVRAACKPISTLRKPLESVDLASKEKSSAAYERSDVCVVPAACVIGEAVVAFELARAFLAAFGADSYEETSRRHAAFVERTEKLTGAPRP